MRRFSRQLLGAVTLAAAALMLTTVGCNKAEEEEAAVQSEAAETAPEGGVITKDDGEPLLPSGEPGANADEQAKPADGADPAAGAQANADNIPKKTIELDEATKKQLAEQLKAQGLDPKLVEQLQGGAAPPQPDPIPAPADVAAPPADAEKTASGLASKVLQPGTGKQPGANDVVKVHYTGWTTDGKMFDSSVQRGQPAEFPLGGVIEGWTEGLQLMKVGEKRRFWIPEELAYKGRAGAPAGMLVFDVELLDVPQSAPPVPENLIAPADAEKTASGLAYKILKPATGAESPVDGDTVEIHFSGWFSDGKMFDSTEMRGESLSVPLDRLWPGWIEGLKLMKVGEKRRLWISKDGMPPAPPQMEDAPEGAVIDVELISVKSAPKAPEDVAAPPADAEKTESGLASKLLQKGTGTVNPTADQTVEVHYTGWTTDGKMFDSSVMRGQPAKFPLGGVIKGWTEGVQLMTVGEKRRFWIPAELAYGENPRPGAPQGMLVFDIELLKIM